MREKGQPVAEGTVCRASAGTLILIFIRISILSIIYLHMWLGGSAVIIYLINFILRLVLLAGTNSYEISIMFIS